ncbi:MAG: hypothetical protein U1F61_19845 [Opitutaceae bacterium]
MNSVFTLLVLFLGVPVAVVGAETAQLYAAVGMTKAQKNSSIPTDSGLYRREGSGEWRHFGPRILGIATVAGQPGAPGVLLIGSADGVIRSVDGGGTWRKTTGWQVADVRSLAFDRNQPSRVYAATLWGPIRSEDGGATWSLAQAGLTELYCQTVVADRARTHRVILGTADGVFVSTDGAVTWNRVPSPSTTILRLAQSEANPRLLIAGTQHRGAWISRDAGETWVATDPASATANLYAVALHRRDASVLAVGGWSQGVRVSSDGGATWQDRSAGLPVRNVLVLAFDPDADGRLWASTFEEGTFFSDDLGRTWKSGGLYGAHGFDFSFLPAPLR